MIKAVIFDMYETLITHYNCPLYFSAEMAEDAGIPVQNFKELWYPTEGDRTTGKLTLEETLELILKKNDCYSSELLEQIAAKRTATKVECFEHLHPEILPMLDRLKEKGILVGLISNCFSEEAAVIRKSVLFPYFDAVCLSYDEGVKKPDVEIYERCMKRLGVKAKECLYVGDGGSFELETARELGMEAVQAVWYLLDGTTQPSCRMADFVQVEKPLDVVERIIL